MEMSVLHVGFTRGKQNENRKKNQKFDNQGIFSLLSSRLP